ncbi:MAG: ring-1,2-phenylacetyl-CoA epoxidase subunit PaaD [Kiritimatiellia bacterium]|jgi:ring-1,2-phenylacetyl-CoA epoxidase subunit PaaD
MQIIPVKPLEQYEREQCRASSEFPEIWKLLDDVMDPEIPVLSLWDVGVLCDVQCDGEKVVVTITPTYSGCPAIEVMKEDIKIILKGGGYERYEVKTQLSPAWTTDWMTVKGRDQMRGYGIAPPNDALHLDDGLSPRAHVRCPFCESYETEQVSEFGSTACKALFKCNTCLEPFDYFKHI